VSKLWCLLNSNWVDFDNMGRGGSTNFRKRSATNIKFRSTPKEQKKCIYFSNFLKLRNAVAYLVVALMLQAERLRVRFPIRSFDFPSGLILPTAIWPWGRIRL
jgi:hypothetical protein